MVAHAFSYGQLQLPVSALIISLGGLKHGLLERRWAMLRRIRPDGYRKGRDAAPLLGVIWEDHRGDPLVDVQRRDRIDPVLPAGAPS